MSSQAQGLKEEMGFAVRREVHTSDGRLNKASEDIPTVADIAVRVHVLFGSLHE